nr:MAG TPA: hypothetical protein [Bacteriophage sp.]
MINRQYKIQFNSRVQAINFLMSLSSTSSDTSKSTWLLEEYDSFNT